MPTMPTVQLTAAGDTTARFYYAGVAQPPSAAVAQSPSTANWNIIETRNGSNQTTFQYLWAGMGGPGVSPGSYIDELIWIDKNGDPTESNDTDPDDQTGESTADQRYFVHQDRNWNVTALTEYDTGGSNNGRIVERYSYTPYGSFVVLAGDSGNGELGSASLTSSIGNVFAHQGLPFDHEKGSYQNRARSYAARHRAFGQRDPFASSRSPSRAWRDGMSAYVYVRSQPTAALDPTGEQCTVGWRRGSIFGGGRPYHGGLNVSRHGNDFTVDYGLDYDGQEICCKNNYLFDQRNDPPAGGRRRLILATFTTWTIATVIVYRTSFRSRLAGAVITCSWTRGHIRTATAEYAMLLTHAMLNALRVFCDAPIGPTIGTFRVGVAGALSPAAIATPAVADSLQVVAHRYIAREVV